MISRLWFRPGLFDENARIELLEGEIYHTSPINTPHARCVFKLNKYFYKYLDQSKYTFDSQNPLEIDDKTLLQPDLAVLNYRPDMYEKSLQAEDAVLVIEVADSSLKHDKRVKLPIYAGAGIPEYWIVDVNNERVEKYSEPEDGQYQPFQSAYREVTFNKVTIQLKDLFSPYV